MSPKPSFAARLVFRVASRGTAHAVVPAALAAIAIVAAGAGMLHRAPPTSGVLLGDTVVIHGPQRFDAPVAKPADSLQTVYNFPDSFAVTVTPTHRYVVRVTNGEPDGSARVVNGTVDGITVDARMAVKTFEIAVRPSRVLLVSMVGQPHPGHLTVEVLEITGGDFFVFGLERFSRGNGPAVNFTRAFTVGPSAGAPFFLWIVNGNADGTQRLSGVTVSLNGDTVVRGLSQTGPAVLMQGVVPVQGRNQILITLPNQPPGSIEVGVTATDVTPPTLTVATPAPGLITRDTAATVTGTVADASPVGVTVNAVKAARSGNSYSATVPLAEGSNRLTISAVDAAGTRADSIRTVIRDRQAPILTLTSPADRFVTNQTMITVAGTVTDLTARTVTVNSVPLPVDGSGAFSGSATLAGGANILTVTASDAAGNTNTVVRNGTRHAQAQPPNLASMMTGITHTLLTSGTNATNLSVYTTASIAPAANALITVAVLGRRSTGAQTPTITGGGMSTWTLVGTVDYDPISGPLSRVAVFRALSSAPGSGTLTITFPNGQSNATWVVSQWSGVDVSGVNGAGAIVQSGSTRGDAVTTLSKTLSAFGNANNVAYGVVGVSMNGPVVTPGTGFTEIAEPTSGENTLLEAEWGVNLTTVSANWTSAKNAGLLGIEIKAAGGGGGGINQTLLTSGTNATNQSVYTTASITPAANALITVAVLGRRSSGPQTPTVTGGGMSTWTQVASVDYDVISAPLSRITVFRALSSAPGSGTLTITFPSGQSNATWIVSQWSGVDVSGVNGAGAIVQVASARGDAVGTLSKTLAAFANVQDVAYGVVGAGINGPAVTPGTGFTEVAEPTSGENNLLEAEWGVNLTNVSASFTAASNAGLLAFEIKAAGGAGGGVFAALSTVSASPTSIPAGSGTSTITVTAKDASGNPVSGAVVVLAATGSGNTITQPSGPTNASGVATGTLSSTVAETKTVSATANGIAITQTATVTVTPVAGTITHTLLTSGTNATNQTVYTTASIAPAANALVTIAVMGQRSSGALTPTVTGGGMSTWTQVANVDYGPISAPLSRITVFRALSSTPGSGPLTITYSSGQSNATWIVSQWSGVEASGANGAGAIVQIASARGDAVSTLSKTLAAFANVNDVAYGVVGASLNGPAVTPGSGFTEIAEPTSGESTLLEAERAVNLTNVSATFTAANNAGLLAFELKAGGGVGGGVFATQSTVTASPTSVPVGSGTSTITVTTKDASGNPVSGATVVLAATGGANTLTQPSGPTNASGVATGTLSSTVAETKTVSATANGIAITQTASVTFTAASGSITHTLLTSGTNATNQSVYTTASIAPAANALVTVAVLGRRSSGAQTPTVTGGGMTSWTLVASVDYDPISGPLSRVAVFRALNSAPGSGPLTITYANGQSNATWIVSQWSGVDVSGVNGAGAIVQSASTRGDAVTTLSKTLSAFGGSTNVAYGLVGVGMNGPAVTPGSGFTEIVEPTSGENNLLEAEWGVNLTNVSAGWTSAKNAGLLGMEIKAAGAGGQPPLEPPPIDSTVATNFATATEFLYTGSNPVQTGVAPGTIDPGRAAVLRGRVLTAVGQPLSGVTVTILGHPELGQTLSRADGGYDLAVNGGGQLTLAFSKTGLLVTQRQIEVPWQDYVPVDDVRMTVLDVAVTHIDFTAPVQVARGSPVTDADGARQGTLFFKQGTLATMVFPNGSEQALSSLNVRVTEYTVGPNGPAAMPAPLPPASAYTYAAEFSADEVLAAGGKELRFSQPVPFYLENFLGFPVGIAVPMAFYDRGLGAWIPSQNGRVVQVVSETGGLAQLDITGDGVADDATTLGVDDAERQRVAELYNPGQSLWRIPVRHFSPSDANFPSALPDGAELPHPQPASGEKNKDDPCNGDGSIVECENQTLGERIRVTGTEFTLNYRSDRVPGRQASRELVIPLIGDTAPPGLGGIVLEIHVAGQTFEDSFPATPNQETRFVWDGKDAYGRTPVGVQPVTIRIGYIYPGVYRQPAPGDTSFGEPGGAALPGVESRIVNTLNRLQRTTVGGWDARAEGLGGWTLDVHHVYDPIGGVVYLGDGSRRSALTLGQTISTVAGNGENGFIEDDVPAASTSLSGPNTVLAAPDGCFYIADSFNARVRKVCSDGIIRAVAGNGTFASGPDGGQATATSLNIPAGLAVGPDGALYIAEFSAGKIRRVGADGIISTVAGTGTNGFNGDGRLATATQLNGPFGLAFGPDGAMYVGDYNNNRVRRIGADSVVTTLAGTGSTTYNGDGIAASTANLNGPAGVAVSAQGEVYIGDARNNRVRRVSAEGIITTFAGNGAGQPFLGTFSGDGGPATEAGLNFPQSVSLGADGVVYIADWNNSRVRLITPDGTMRSFVGMGDFHAVGDGGAPLSAGIDPGWVSIGASGVLYVADVANNRIRAISPTLPALGLGDMLIASADGSQFHRFSPEGRHLSTIDALTASVVYQFSYSTDGLLTGVTDANGNATVVERGTGGVPTAITSPFGARTTLSVNSDAFLASVTDPANQSVGLHYETGGLLDTLTTPRGHTHRFTYDTLGRLTRDEGPSGEDLILVRQELATATEVELTTAEGRSTVYRLEPLPTGELLRKTTDPAGNVSQVLVARSDSMVSTGADGTVTTMLIGPDPRAGLAAPIPQRLVTQTPGGRTMVSTTARVVTRPDSSDPLSLTSEVDSVSLNGRWTVSTYTAATRRLVETSPEGRQRFGTLDDKGRLIAAQIAGLDSARLTYDPAGRLSQEQVGGRIWTYSYDTRGRLLSTLDPLGRRDSLFYDTADRLIRSVLPDGRTVLFDYDPNGNLASLTPPSRPEHGFQYTPSDFKQQYDPPGIPGPKPTRYFYNRDKQVDSIVRPDSISIRFGYDGGGRPSSVTFDRGTTSFGYSSTTGNLVAIRAPTGDSLTFTYDGALPTQVRWVGGVAGTVQTGYNDEFRVSTQTVDGAYPITFSYDQDGLLTGAEALRLGRSMTNGLLVADTLNALRSAYRYSSHGELDGYRVTHNSTALFATGYARDSLGRITQLFDTTQGTPTRWSYVYDSVGRLATDSINGTILQAFTYDANNNRLTLTSSNGTIDYSYDAQDRLLSAGTTSYTYGSNGELKTKTIPGVGVTTYTYDALGNLVTVVLPTATRIDYVIDGQNRRIGRKVNGVLVQAWLYQNQLNPVAELDGSANVVSRFVYGSRTNVPDFMVKNGVTYRLVSDHIGSVRLVVDVVTGAVVQRISYDPWGVAVENTNPGLQPFGYAGGLYDDQTGFVRFGARDYDPATGRWTTKDPAGLLASEMNVFIYGSNDPVNSVDPSGRQAGEALATGWAVAVAEPTPVGEIVMTVVTVGVALAALVVTASEVADESDRRPRRGRWTCSASCNVQAIGNPCCPQRVTGMGSGPSEALACLEAKRAATQSTPLGCYPRHCRCTCYKR